MENQISSSFSFRFDEMTKLSMSTRSGAHNFGLLQMLNQGDHATFLDVSHTTTSQSIDMEYLRTFSSTKVIPVDSNTSKLMAVENSVPKPTPVRASNVTPPSMKSLNTTANSSKKENNSYKITKGPQRVLTEFGREMMRKKANESVALSNSNSKNSLNISFSNMSAIEMKGREVLDGEISIDYPSFCESTSDSPVNLTENIVGFGERSEDMKYQRTSAFSIVPSKSLSYECIECAPVEAISESEVAILNSSKPSTTFASPLPSASQRAMDLENNSKPISNLPGFLVARSSPHQPSASLHHGPGAIQNPSIRRIVSEVDDNASVSTRSVEVKFQKREEFSHLRPISVASTSSASPLKPFYRGSFVPLHKSPIKALPNENLVKRYSHVTAHSEILATNGKLSPKKEPTSDASLHGNGSPVSLLGSPLSSRTPPHSRKPHQTRLPAVSPPSANISSVTSPAFSGSRKPKIEYRVQTVFGKASVLRVTRSPVAAPQIASKLFSPSQSPSIRASSTGESAHQSSSHDNSMDEVVQKLPFDHSTVQDTHSTSVISDKENKNRTSRPTSVLPHHSFAHVAPPVRSGKYDRYTVYRPSGAADPVARFHAYKQFQEVEDQISTPPKSNVRTRSSRTGILSPTTPSSAQQMSKRLKRGGALPTNESKEFGHTEAVNNSRLITRKAFSQLSANVLSATSPQNAIKGASTRMKDSDSLLESKRISVLAARMALTKTGLQGFQLAQTTEIDPKMLLSVLEH